MDSVLRGFSVIACAAALYGQSPTPRQPVPGLETDWDIAAVLQELGNYGGRLLEGLDKIDPAAWQSKGASETYGEQLKSSKDQARALTLEAKALARAPEKLSSALQLYFRIVGIDTMLGSLEEGLLKYQSPADAAGLASLGAESGANRDRLQRYIVALSAQQERQLQVMDSEAQRCRSLLIGTPQSSKRKK